MFKLVIKSCGAGRILYGDAKALLGYGKNLMYSTQKCLFSTRAYSSVVKIKKPLSTLDGLRRSTNTQESVQNILKLLNKSDGIESSELSKYVKLVSAVTIADNIKFEVLQSILKSLSYDYKIVVPEQVIYAKVPNTTPAVKEVIFLANGTIVGWNLAEEEIIKLVPNFLPAIEERYEYESDEFDYIELDELPPNPKNNGNSYMINDMIVIQNQSSYKKILDKIAFSIGLSRSTRISILENSLEDFLKLTKINSKNLSKGLKITTNEHDILKLTGKLFLLRGKLNLYSELIDTPDLYWSEPTLEKIYQQISTNLDISSRISILNRKLDYATEEQRAFLSLLNERKSTKLEWTIIVLILIEVGFETYRFLE